MSYKWKLKVVCLVVQFDETESETNYMIIKDERGFRQKKYFVQRLLSKEKP